MSEKGELEGPGSDPNSPGDTGFFSRDSFSGVVKPFVDLAFDLQIGEINKEIIEVDVQGTEYYMIFRKEEYQEERQKPYEEVKDDVSYAAEEKLREDLTKAWLEGLKQKAAVQVFANRIDLPSTEEELEDTTDTDEDSAITAPESDEPDSADEE